LKVPTLKVHTDRTGIKLIEILTKSPLTSKSLTVGFKYEDSKNLLSKPQDIFMIFDSLELKVRIKDERYPLGR
jgi:hypothetical protein